MSTKKKKKIIPILKKVKLKGSTRIDITKIDKHEEEN